MKRLLFLAAVLTLCFFCGCKQEEAGKEKKLIMVTNATFPPYEYVDKGKIDGIDPEVVRRIALRLGYELEIQDMAFDAIIAAVQSGKAQIAASGITVTEDRKQKIAFTDSYVIAAQVMIVPENSPVKSEKDLKGKRIGVQHGTTGDTYVKENIQEPHRYQSGPDAVSALIKGKLDVVVIDGEPAEAYVSKNPGLKILPEPLVQEEYAFAIGKNNRKLLNEFNVELRKMKESGELANIINAYRQPRVVLVLPEKDSAEKKYIDTVISRVAEKLNFRVEIQDGTLENITNAAKIERKQIVVSAIPIREDEKKLVPNYQVLTVAEYVAVVPKNSKIKDFAGLHGKKIGTLKGSFAEHYVEKHIVPPQNYKNAAEAIDALVSGKIDLAVIEKNTALKLLEKNQKLLILPETFAREDYVLACGNDNQALQKEFVDGVMTLQKNGDLSKILAEADQVYKNQPASIEEQTDPNLTSDGSWIDGIRLSFYNNFIKDQRYAYLVKGFFVTIEITVLAVLMGIVIGFLVAVVRSTADVTGKWKLLDALCRVYLTVIRGTPVVVQLLIIYFVIFGSVDVDKVLVAVIAFGINSGAYVAEIIRGGIMSIDKGQMEAGRSLGLSYGQTMREIILPQAFKNVLPSLGNEFIVLLKETSVAGYIALQDLTRGGDIIRSQTYDAFFPLIAVALIYLVVVMFLSWLLGRLEKRLKRNE